MSGRRSAVLLDDEHVRIDYWRRGSKGGTLAVTFDPLLYLCDKPPFGHEFFAKQGIDVVSVRKKAEHFYQPLTRAAFATALRPLKTRYARIVCYGSSLGAYAALYYARDLPWTVIASSPRVSVHPVYGAQIWQQRCGFRHEPFRADAAVRCDAIIFYDPRDAIDRRYIEGEVLPQFTRARVVRVPFAGHPANQFLGDIGYIAPYVRAVVAGTTPPALQRRAHRARSATYHQVLALTCVQHGHVAWADALVQRALALNPRRMLAHRTLGLVRLAQQRWSDAQAALEFALEFDPQDPYSLALLARARAGPSSLSRQTARNGGCGWLRRVWHSMAGHLKRKPGERSTL
jgi:tetratricopeptide (TPR) repeat protein